METKQIFTSRVTEGMILAKDIYDKNDRLIIPKGTTLTENLISKIKTLGIFDVTIQITKIEEPDNNKELSYYQKLRSSQEFQKFNKTFLKTTNDIRNAFINFAYNNENLDTEQLYKQTEEVLQAGKSSLDVLSMLQCTKDYDDVTYTHSLNVAITSSILGKWLNLSTEDNKILTVAALLHDIGKTQIPNEIINKPSQLTPIEYQTIKMHTIKGYTMLKKLDLDPRIANCALLHHERVDGSGYPNKISSNDIPDFAKIIAIADVYDAMSSKRLYRDKISPFTIIEMFEKEGYDHFDAKFLITFLNGITQVYLNNNVKLSNGQEGVIIMLNQHSLSRPIIKLNDGTFLDLSTNKSITIEEIY